jgi:predicted DNA-binding transcriptional regulator AlpA
MTNEAQRNSIFDAPAADESTTSQKRQTVDLRPESPILKDGDQLLRLDQIIGPKGFVPVSKSTWHLYVAQGRIKKPIMLGPRIACYWKSDVLAFIAELEVSNGEG